MRGLIIAFAMYSKIPMPRVEWNEKNMRYALCWFPMVGVIIGAMQWICYRIFLWLETATLESGIVIGDRLLRSVILTVIPLVITGGIHLDGMMDTIDARASYGTREKKLEILKDPRAGAFAVMGCGIYLLLTVAGWQAISERGLLIMVGGFVLERALSGLAAVHFRGAKGDGLLASFRKPAQKRVVSGILTVVAILAALFMISHGRCVGICGVIAAVTTFLFYHQMAMREFGGITGDLAGWFLQKCELAMLLTVVLSEWIFLL